MQYNDFVRELADVVAYTFEQNLKDSKNAADFSNVTKPNIANCLKSITLLYTILYRAKLTGGLISLMKKSSDPYTKDNSIVMKMADEGAITEIIQRYIQCRNCFNRLYPQESEWLSDFFIDIESEK